MYHVEADSLTPAIPRRNWQRVFSGRDLGDAREAADAQINMPGQYGAVRIVREENGETETIEFFEPCLTCRVQRR